MIALSLTAILLTTLFTYLIEYAKIEKKVDIARLEITNRSHLQTRLQSLFTSVDQSSLNPYFYTKTFEKEKILSLVTIFDNGIDPDPAFSGSIIGKIFLDSEKNLSLALWPSSQEKNPPWRKEILLSNIDRFAFEFLGEIEGKETSRPVSANLCWKSEWVITQRGVPAMIRLTVHKVGEKEPIEYAFHLPSEELMAITRESV